MLERAVRLSAVTRAGRGRAVPRPAVLKSPGGATILAFPRVRRPPRRRWWRRFLGWIRYGSVAVARPR